MNISQSRSCPSSSASHPHATVLRTPQVRQAAPLLRQPLPQVCLFQLDQGMHCGGSGGRGKDEDEANIASFLFFVFRPKCMASCFAWRSSLRFFRRPQRLQTSDCKGRVAIVTGGRVKIGYQIAIKLIRAGAHVIVTTRFPHDAIERFAAVGGAQEQSGSRLCERHLLIHSRPQCAARSAGKRL